MFVTKNRQNQIAERRRLSSLSSEVEALSGGLTFVLEIFIPLTISATSPGFLQEETNVLFLPGTSRKRYTFV